MQNGSLAGSDPSEEAVIASQVCNKCGEKKPLLSFSLRTRASQKRRGRCKACDSKVDPTIFLARLADTAACNFGHFKLHDSQDFIES